MLGQSSPQARPSTSAAKDAPKKEKNASPKRERQARTRQGNKTAAD